MLDLGSTIVQIFYIVHIFKYSLRNDTYDADSFDFYFFIGLGLSIATYLMRLVSCLVFSCFTGVTDKQKSAMLTTILSPPFKYYLLRKNPND